jgi:hypothetical protein
MIQRKALTINNGAALKRTKLFNQSRAFLVPKQQKQEASIFNYARRGRNAQANGAAGGGKVVGKRLS